MADLSLYENFKAVLLREVERMRGLSTVDFVRECIDLAPDHAPDITIADALKMATRDGSISAAAALSVMGAPDAEVATLLRGIVRRSPDLEEAIAVETLAQMLEEWADEEVAAGRMTYVIDPKSGRKLYSFKGDAP